MSYTTYQGGSREGEELESEAIWWMENMLKYGPNDLRWSNYHDAMRETLSYAIRDAKLLLSQEGGGKDALRLRV